MYKQSFAKRVLQTATLTTVSVFATLALLEAVTRVAGIGRLPHRRPDPLLGVRSIPNAAYEYRDEGYSGGRINSLGLRDREIPYMKTENAKRILILGDSFMEALQVNLDGSFPKLLQTFIGEALPEHNIETVNAGRGGMGTVEEYLWYVTEGVKYRPDLVLLAFYAGNDFRDNSKSLTGRAALKPYIIFDADTFRVDASFSESRSYKIRAFFWPLFNASVLAAETARRIGVFMNGIAAKAGGAPCPKDVGVFGAFPDGVWDSAYTATGKLVALLDGAVKRNASAFCVMIVPDSYQIEDAESECVKGADLRKPNRFIRETAEARGIPVFDLTDAFEREHSLTGDYMYGFGKNLGTGHWNEKGHRLAAQTIASDTAFLRLLR